MKKILILLVCLFSISLIAQENKEKPLKYKEIKNDAIKPFNYEKVFIIPDSIVKKYKIDVKKMEAELNKLQMNSYTTIDSVVKVK